MALSWLSAAGFRTVYRSRYDQNMTDFDTQDKNPSPADLWANFRELLDSQSDWPSEYLFKFITPKAKLDDVKSVLSEAELTVRASSKGKYLSVTARVMVDSPDDVIAIYSAAGSIEGVISL